MLKKQNCSSCLERLVRNGSKQLRRISIREITFEKVQQWWCKNCRQSFTFRRNDGRQRFTDIFIREAVKDFIQGRSSYAVIKERKDVSIGTLSNWIHQFGNSCMNPVEMAGALRLRTHKQPKTEIVDSKISQTCSRSSLETISAGGILTTVYGKGGVPILA